MNEVAQTGDFRLRHRIYVVAAICVGIAAAGCSGDPAVEKQRYFESGNRYAAKGQHAEAIIEYRNAITLDQLFADARYRLAESYATTGDTVNAVREYVRAADLLPGNVAAQLKAGGYLLVFRRFEDARMRADKALAVDPDSADAHILRGNALAGLHQLDSAIAEVEEAIAIDPDALQAYMSLGALQLYRNRQAEAEAAFLRAVELAPASVPAHLAMANYYWTIGRADDTHQWLRKAVAVDPKNLDANRALGVFLLVMNRAPEAEESLRRVADASNSDGARLALADYYLATGRKSEAVPILRGIDRAAGTVYSRAQARLASLDYRDKPAQAHALIDARLREAPQDLELLTLKSRMLLDENRLDEAAAAAKAAVEAHPRSAGAHHARGLVHIARNELNEAIASFNEVARLNPQAVTARLQLVRAHMLKGGTTAAAQYAEEAVRLQPRDPTTRLILARALMADRRLTRAGEILEALVAEYPAWPPAVAQLATVHLALGDTDKAQASYEQALRVEPDLLEAIAGLVAIDITSKRPDAGRARIDAALGKSPNDVGVLLLAARTYAATGDLTRSEQSLRRVIELDASVLQAYSLLAELYLRTGRIAAAAEEFRRLVARQPDSVAGYTMIGILLQAQNRIGEAIAEYRRAVAMDSRAAVAANNLAWLYGEGHGSLDEALALAQMAKGKLPSQPEINDTLAWIYYKKGMPTFAIPLLRDSVERDPQNAIYHYHLGLAYAKADQLDRARTSLTEALRLRPEIDQSGEAQRLLRRKT
jgi:tetratricopeptide (TPR) repeat protein